MRRVLLFTFGFVFAGLTAASLLVPSSQSSETRFLPMLGNDVVLHMMAIASAQLVANPAATEHGQAPITFADARRVVDLAAASASAAWCGVEWKRGNLNNLMVAERANGRRDAAALAYVAKLHEVAMEMFERDLRETSACPERRKDEVAEFLAARWRNGVAVALENGAVENRAARP